MVSSFWHIHVCKAEMTALWAYIIGFLFMILQCAVLSQSEDPKNRKFTLPMYKSSQDKKLEVKEILPTCIVSSWSSSVIYILSRIPKVTCTCVWPDNATDVVYPEWVLESYLKDVLLENRRSSNTTETEAFFTIPDDSWFHKGKTMSLILTYRLPGIAWKSDKYILKIQKSRYNGDCQEADDCYFKNSTCVWNQCKCPFDLRYLDGYGCYSGKNLGESCEISEECSRFVSRSFCSSSKICECKHPYKITREFCESSDSIFPVFYYVITGVIVVGLLGLVSAFIKKRRSMRSGVNGGLESPDTGVIVSGQTSMLVPERRDYPPIYTDLTSTEPQPTVLETPPPGYDQWQQVPAFDFQASMADAQTDKRAATSPVTRSPTRSVSTEQCQSNAALVSDSQT